MKVFPWMKIIIHISVHRFLCFRALKTAGIMNAEINERKKCGENDLRSNTTESAAGKVEVLHSGPGDAEQLSVATWDSGAQAGSGIAFKSWCLNLGRVWWPPFTRMIRDWLLSSLPTDRATFGLPFQEVRICIICQPSVIKQLHKLNKDFCTFWSSLKKPPWRRQPGGLSPTCLATSRSGSPGGRTDTSGATHPLVVC